MYTHSITHDISHTTYNTHRKNTLTHYRNDTHVSAHDTQHTHAYANTTHATHHAEISTTTHGTNLNSVLATSM